LTFPTGNWKGQQFLALLGDSLVLNGGQTTLPPDPADAPLPDRNLAERIDTVVERLDRIEALLQQLVQEPTVKDHSSTAEAAELQGKAEFTAREWCRLGRIHAEKRQCGRGQAQEWMIAHAELLRIQNEGLLPAPRTSTRV
jgi:hypothetical protein